MITIEHKKLICEKVFNYTVESSYSYEFGRAKVYKNNDRRPVFRLEHLDPTGGHFYRILEKLDPVTRKKLNEIIRFDIVPQDGFHEFDYVTKITWFADEDRKTAIISYLITILEEG